MNIDYKSVNSTNVQSVGYDHGTKTLAVRFKNGGEYHYYDVPPSKHQALMGASSIGGHLHSHIISGGHRHTKIS